MDKNVPPSKTKITQKRDGAIFVGNAVQTIAPFWGSLIMALGNDNLQVVDIINPSSLHKCNGTN
jgi:hypothetical protein